jgi:2-iminobutanoate/2-iminopropanoate deaminase
MTSFIKTVTSTEAPEALGPYSQAVIANNIVFCSGQLGIVPDTNKIVSGGITAETTQALENIKAILQQAGTDLNHIVNTKIYLHDVRDFEEMNKTYASYFSINPPSRSTIPGIDLPKGALVEIEVTALLPQ